MPTRRTRNVLLLVRLYQCIRETGEENVSLVFHCETIGFVFALGVLVEAR